MAGHAVCTRPIAGSFPSRTFRMHPDLCSLRLAAFVDQGQLGSSDDSLARCKAITLGPLSETGTRFLPVFAFWKCAQMSAQEVSRLSSAEVERLLARRLSLPIGTRCHPAPGAGGHPR